MHDLRFEWDIRKAAQNKRKHGVSFKEAQAVFLDEQALSIADPDHSAQEERFLLLGLGSPYRILVVCHCYRRGDVIRIISARKASQKERNQYEQRWSK